MYLLKQRMSSRKDDQNKENRIPENDPSKAMDSKKEVEQSNDNKTDQDFPGYPHYPAREDIMDQRTDSHRVDVDVENLPSNNRTGVSQRFMTGEDGTRGRNQEVPGGDEFQDIGPRTDVGNERRSGLDGTNAEIGVPHNADNDSLARGGRPGTDLQDEMSDNESSDADVTSEERQILEQVDMPTNDAENLRRSALDSRDFEGDELNEESFGTSLSSVGLDMPEESDETESTAMGEGDEENKYYSLGGDRHDNLEEDPYSGPQPGES
jgi:hypothetical protein